MAARSGAALDHVGLVVSDVQRSVEWYATALHAAPLPDELRDERGTSRRLAFANLELELTQPDRPGDAYSLGANDAGAFHICPRVDDIDAEYQRLTALGITTTTAPGELLAGTGMRTLFLRDPDGLLVQLLEIPGAEPAPGDRPALHHLGVTVTAIEPAAAWFADALGVEILSWHENGGELLSEMFQIAGTTERAVLLDVGSTLLELMVWDTPTGRPASIGPQDVGAGLLAFVRSSGAVGDLELGHSGSPLADAPDQISVHLAATP
jgi:catechol 2,3-dioxygenase-like lactoylglutathione lyase family enzyme